MNKLKDDMPPIYLYVISIIKARETLHMMCLLDLRIDCGFAVAVAISINTFSSKVGGHETGHAWPTCTVYTGFPLPAYTSEFHSY